MKKLEDQLNVDRLAKLFDLPPWEDLYEMNLDYIAEAGYAAQQAVAEDATEDELEEVTETAEQAAGIELHHQWASAVVAVSEELFDKHGLNLASKGQRMKDAYEFKIVPVESWAAAADAIRETVNGVGHFYFSSLREFLASGPYTPRQAVLSHLGWIASYPDVYGATSAKRMYESYWR